MADGGLLFLLIPAVLLVLIGSGWWLGGRPDLARVTIEAGEVWIVPAAVLRGLSFRRELRFDRALVTGAAVLAAPAVATGGIRGPGTGLPGLRAGTYRWPGVTSYWLVGRGGRLLRIELRDSPLDYVLIQVRDPEALAGLLGQGPFAA